MERNFVCEFCNVSGKRERLEKLYEWDNPEKWSWYCEEHYRLARGFQNKQKQAFLEYYKEEGRRKWLSGKSLDLYERLRQKK